MDNLKTQINSYLNYCRYQKKLDEKTLKAYQIDLKQLASFSIQEAIPLTKDCLSSYVQALHSQYKPKTVKRKIASTRAFLNHLEFDEQIDTNPIDKLRLQFREPLTLPKALPLNTIQKLLKTAYRLLKEGSGDYQYDMRLRNVAVLELMFATGLRVSELCSIKPSEIDLKNGFVKVQGKGARERIVFISNPETLSALRKYRDKFKQRIASEEFFFLTGCKKN